MQKINVRNKYDRIKQQIEGGTLQKASAEGRHLCLHSLFLEVVEHHKNIYKANDMASP